jgi:hypothetical protein
MHSSSFLRSCCLIAGVTTASVAAAKESDRPTVVHVASAAPVAASAASPAAAAPTAAVGTKVAWRAGTVPQHLWTGFRSDADGGGEVLIQTTGEVELESRPSKDGTGTIFLLKHCRAGRRIDQLPLDTRFFQSPVTRVAVRPLAGNLEIAVSLRGSATAVSRKDAGPGGSWFGVLTFRPAGADGTVAAPTPSATPRPTTTSL